MLRADDATVVRGEPGIPSLELLLDPDLLLEVLTSTAFGSRWERLLPTYLRYKPETRALAAYRGVGPNGLESLYAIAHGEDSDHKIRGGDSVRDRGVVHLPHHGLSVFRFPFDRRLRSLSKIDTAGTRDALLRRTMPEETARWTGLEVLAYKPERRCVLRADGSRSAVLKFFSTSAFPSMRVRARALASSLAFAPKLVGGSRRHRILAFDWAAGDLLRDRLSSASSSSADALAETGRCLAELHGAAVPLDTFGHHAGLPDLGASVSALAGLLPSQRPWVEKLGANLAAFADSGHPRPGFCHGDFYAKQIVVSQRHGIRFLDFDRAGWADIHRDPANFWAHLERDHLCGRLGAEPQDLLSHLLVGYAGRVALDPQRLSGFTALALFSLAMHPFRDRDQNWHGRTLALLRRTEALLQEAKTTPVYRFRRTPALPDALDATRGPSVVAECLGVPRGCVGAGVLVRHKPGRRAVVRYALGDGAVIGKTRDKGVDKRAHAIQERLFQAVASGRPPTELRLARPLGVVPELSMWLQAESPGCPAMPLLLGRRGHEVARRIADALWDLHGLPVATDRSHDRERELEVLLGCLDRAATLRPTLASRIEALAKRLRDRVRAAPSPGRTAGIHRDFYPDQVLVHAEHVCFVDLDLYCRGEVELDVGNFIAHLEEYALRRALGTGLAPVASAFRDQYLRHSKHSAPGIELYRVLSLARQIFLSTQFPERGHSTSRLLAACEAATPAHGVLA